MNFLTTLKIKERSTNHFATFAIYMDQVVNDKAFLNSKAKIKDHTFIFNAIFAT